jgi:hypothetical protein
VLRPSIGEAPPHPTCLGTTRQTTETGKQRRKLYADAMQVYLKAKDFIVQLPAHTKLYRAEKVTPRDLKYRW